MRFERRAARSDAAPFVGTFDLRLTAILEMLGVVLVRALPVAALVGVRAAQHDRGQVVAEETLGWISRDIDEVAGAEFGPAIWTPISSSRDVQRIRNASLAENMPARPGNARLIQHMVADHAHVLIRREPRIHYARRVNAYVFSSFYSNFWLI